MKKQIAWKRREQRTTCGIRVRSSPTIDVPEKKHLSILSFAQGRKRERTSQQFVRSRCVLGPLCDRKDECENVCAGVNPIWPIFTVIRVVDDYANYFVKLSNPPNARYK